MANGPGIGEGGGGGVAAAEITSAESGSGISSGIETTASPITPEAPIQAGEISDETTLDNATGVGPATNITDKVSTEVAPVDLLKDIADGKNINEAGMENRRKIMSDAEDDTSPAQQPENQTDKSQTIPKPKNEAKIDNYNKIMGINQPDVTDLPNVEPNKTDTNTPQNTEDPKKGDSGFYPQTKGFFPKPQDNLKTDQPTTTENDQPPTADQATDQKNVPTNETPINTKTDMKEPPAEDKKPEEETQKPEDKKPEEKKSPEDIAEEIANLRKILSKKNEEFSEWQNDSDAIKKQKYEEFGNINIKIEQLKKELPGKDRNNTEPPLEENEMTGAEVLDQMNKDAAAKRTHENWTKIYEGVDTDKPQIDTKDQTTTDETQKPQDKKPEAEGEKPPDGENEDKKDETPEDPKSEKQKQIEEKMQMADIVSQMKDINPDFDPKNPEAQDFLKNLAENPDQMNTAADTLKMLGEQKTVLENSDALKNLGIDPKDLVAPAAMGTLKALSDTIEKAMRELAGKPNKTKEEEDKNKKDGILLMLLKALGKAMGTVLVVGGAAALTVGKEIQKK